MKLSAVLTTLALLATPLPAASAPIEVQRETSYFILRGSTLADLDREIQRRGPLDPRSKQRSPASSKISFIRSIDYSPSTGACHLRVGEVRVRIDYLEPRWQPFGRRDPQAAAYFRALANDLRVYRNEQLKIARRSAEKMDRIMRHLGPERNCASMEAKTNQAVTHELQSHEEQQQALNRRWYSRATGR